MNKYKVLGEEGAEVTVLGVVHKVGDIIDVDASGAEEAQAAADAGTLELVTE